jgi:hypothetical protein
MYGHQSLDESAKNLAVSKPSNSSIKLTSLSLLSSDWALDGGASSKSVLTIEKVMEV